MFFLFFCRGDAFLEAYMEGLGRDEVVAKSTTPRSLTASPVQDTRRISSHFTIIDLQPAATSPSVDQVCFFHLVLS